MINPNNLVILGIEAFEGNSHDSKIIGLLLNKVNKSIDYQPQEVIYDRGGKGIPNINGTIISTLNPPKKSATEYQKRVARKKFRRRAAIEPVIGHLKSGLE